MPNSRALSTEVSASSVLVKPLYPCILLADWLLVEGEQAVQLGAVRWTVPRRSVAGSVADAAVRVGA
ncbi:MAG TPA: hypothetical protein VIZ60_04185 [Rubrobacter sp.]